MSDIAIKVENLGKKYLLSHLSGDREQLLSSLLLNKFRGIRGVLPGSEKGQAPRRRTEEFWALDDISLEINRGDRVGIIGRNGAGKSTFLKVLSRITEPTKGRITIDGRVASLLEVGTGFHSELSGRENIYLNGAILGMGRDEIKRKFDEIVAFAEVERFLDTPVKRYSSGMYVRLAFAVAAHLEPEILIVDEVLAVGDADFQKKCLGKMEDVSTKEGRTVLFVSHNIGTILSLCNKGIFLSNGKVVKYAEVDQAVNSYLSYDKDQSIVGQYFREPKTIPYGSEPLLKCVQLLDRDMNKRSSFEFGEELNIIVQTNAELKQKFGIEMRIKNSQQNLIAYVSSWISGDGDMYQPGETIKITIPELKFVQDDYYIDFICRLPLVYHVDNWWDTVSFTMTNCRPEGSKISIQHIDRLGSMVIEEAVVTRIDR